MDNFDAKQKFTKVILIYFRFLQHDISIDTAKNTEKFQYFIRLKTKKIYLKVNFAY